VERRIRGISEDNPMLGFRGARLSIVYPELTEMQTLAIMGTLISDIIDE
jgi:pyruvate,orthophosphate dikinase